ncbi:hypothetical protein TSUD_270060 [Trifolium subterraneum]|uniref:Pectate lyase superfamily protein domain-containing protein n=1 Tax=Trifolium subterraneum TaxID=3900 RepID=A0A2Z6NDU7_TRISU|nr:hypothetical protein TSUD_270060 [Trifolium subterraneum]
MMSQGTVNVDDFGAKGDGSDDREAFKKAWNEACSKGAILVVPNRIYRLKPITFSGPCQPNTAFMLYGTIEAWPQMSAYEEDKLHWIVFDSVSNFKVDGGGTFNGNGKKWWQNSCKYSNNNLAVTFYDCKNLRVKNLSIGSLGADKSEAEVSNVIVNRATLTGTTNGVRIKTWQLNFPQSSSLD